MTAQEARIARLEDQLNVLREEVAALQVHFARLEERINAIHNLLQEYEKQKILAYQSAEKARDEAHAAQQQVNTTQNEFRGALKDQQQTLATKEEVVQVVTRLAVLEASNATAGGRASGADSVRDFLFRTLPLLLMGIGIAVTIWLRTG